MTYDKALDLALVRRDSRVITLGQPDWPQERLRLWRIGFPIVRALALLLAPARIEGLQNVPERGPYVIVANHINWKDPPWIAFAFDLAVRYMAKRELFGVLILGGILRAIGCFPVRRGESDRQALLTALRVLDAGQPLGFFPEGTRSRDGRLRRARPGISFLARRSRAPFVPVAVTGTPEARLLRPGAGAQITIRVGEPFRASDLREWSGTDEQALADAIMRRVAALLPPEMRGAYA